MIIAMNAVLKRYGGAAQGDMLLTCATIAQSFMLVVTMPLGGISGSTQTILSFNYGARRPDRVREAQKRVFVLCAVYTGLMMLVAWTCGGAVRAPVHHGRRHGGPGGVGHSRVQPGAAAAGHPI